MSRNPSSAAAAENLFREVWAIERQIPRERGRFHRIGHDGWPGQELVRFRTAQHLGFAGTDLVRRRRLPDADGLDAAELTVDSFGLTGARGVLPAHYTELVLSQLRARSPALRDFLDLFNHRLLSLLYRSWEKTQPAVHQEREGQDPFTRILQALTGSQRHWEIHYGAALGRSTASVDTLQAVLGHLTRMPVEVRSLQGGWQRIEEPDQTRLPSRRRNPRGQFARLGEATLGRRVWMVDRGIQLHFFPKDRQQLRTLLPGGRVSEPLHHLTSRLVPQRMRVDYRLRALGEDLPPTRLGQKGRLGADSFIPSRHRPGKWVDVSFKPSH